MVCLLVIMQRQTRALFAQQQQKHWYETFFLRFTHSTQTRACNATRRRAHALSGDMINRHHKPKKSCTQAHVCTHSRGCTFILCYKSWSFIAFLSDDAPSHRSRCCCCCCRCRCCCCCWQECQRSATIPWMSWMAKHALALGCGCGQTKSTGVNMLCAEAHAHAAGMHANITGMDVHMYMRCMCIPMRGFA